MEKQRLRTARIILKIIKLEDSHYLISKLTRKQAPRQHSGTGKMTHIKIKRTVQKQTHRYRQFTSD